MAPEADEIGAARPLWQGAPAMRAELIVVADDYRRLWEVAGFAEALAARLAAPELSDARRDPLDTVLAVHRRLLVDALRRAQSRGEALPHRRPGDLADAVAGVYLSRRLARVSLDGWVQDALAVVRGEPPATSPQ